MLVATAVERSRDGRDGVYDVTVTVGDVVVAKFVGRSKEIGGTFFDDAPGAMSGTTHRPRFAP